MRNFKTPKGTTLTMIDLRGKDYLQVNQRLVWLNEDVKSFEIQTEFPLLTEQETIARATVTLFGEGGGVLRRAQATKRESKAHFQDHTEKAETSAIGRALAFLGYGTQFAPELEEGERIVDSPVDRKPALKAVSAPETTDYVITIGKKYKGKRLTEVPTHELESFRTWLVDTADKDGKPLSPAAQEFIHAVDAYVGA